MTQLMNCWKLVIMCTMNATTSAENLALERKIYTGTAARLIKLLGAGCTQIEASKACGVDESYTSQLMNEADFKDQVNELIKQTFETQSAIDQTYTDIEKKMSEKLLKATEYMVNPDQMLRVAKFANEAKRRIAPISGSNGNGGLNGGGVTVLAPVTLILPPQVAKEFVMNPVGEVVSVDGKELTTLPSGNIQKLVQEKEAKKRTAIIENKTHGSGYKDPYSDL